MSRRSSSKTATLLLIPILLVLPNLVEAQSPSPYLSIFGKNKVQYRDFKWKVYHSPHFDVYYYTEQAELLRKDTILNNIPILRDKLIEEGSET